MGAWIETASLAAFSLAFLSHPTWVRGLKLWHCPKNQRLEEVAPYVGAWIETRIIFKLALLVEVAPYVGAWIETSRTHQTKQNRFVAPYVGAWIETPK